MKQKLFLFQIVVIILLIITTICGSLIRYGGKEFNNAVNGHMILGIITSIFVISMIVITWIVK